MSTVNLLGPDDDPMGVYVHETIHDFDPQAFGEWLGKQDSRMQSSVIVGMAMSLYGIGEVARSHQIGYLVGDLREDPHQREVDEFMDAMHDHWKDSPL